MKRVLIVSYYWPPSGGAGVQRWLKFVKYMREYGWDPVVYTALNGEIPVADHSLEKEVPPEITVLRRPIWEPYSIYKKFIGRKPDDKINASFLNEGRKAGIAEKISVWIRGNFFIPDARRFWVRPSIRFLHEYCTSSKIDFVISSGPPHSMHLIALGLKRRLPHLRWIADFRDPWTNIDFYDKLMLTWMADRKHRSLEREVLLSANMVLSIGKGMSRQLEEIYIRAGGKDRDKFRVITNGYDTADLSDKPVNKDTKFTIAHIGTLVKDRNPVELWKVLAELVRENRKFSEQMQIKLVGKVDVAVKESIEAAGLTPYLRQISYLPHNEVIIEQQRSSVLLLLVNRTPNAADILTGKFFEYMASGVPILAIGPVEGELAGILRQSGTGYMAGFNDEVAVREAIMALFEGRLPERNESIVAGYSRQALTAKLCRMLDELSA